MIGAARLAARLAAVLAVAGALLPVALLSRALDLAGARRPALRLAARTQRAWGRASLRAAGVELAAEELPPGPALVVANHSTYLDVLVVASLVPARFVALAEMRRWPLLGVLARSAGSIFVDRSRRSDVARVVEEMRSTLAAGVAVVLFPEGGATSGRELEPFRTPLFASAVEAGAPVLPVALFYEAPQAAGGAAAVVAWHGGAPLRPHLLRLLRLSGVRARARVATPVRSGDRKELARRARGAIEGLFEPLR